MQALLFGMMLILVSSTARATEAWENCLDKADFSFDVDTNLFAGSTTSVTKRECRLTIAVSGGKGEKFAVDVCDPNIHIDHYPSLESSPKRVEAGSAGCPAPLFGADFDTQAKEIAEYRGLKTRVFDLWDKIKEFYGTGWEKVDLKRPKLNQEGRLLEEDSPYRIACGELLLKEYLKKCMSFEAKKPETSVVNPMPDIPGVHPQTIPRK